MLAEQSIVFSRVYPCVCERVSVSDRKKRKLLTFTFDFERL